ncbi:hypothetical protein ACFS07_10545 [Undibacterium arcticum]
MQADNAAILSRVKNNERVAEQQHIDNANITKVHDEELSTVRTALARSERLRIGTALCGGSAGVTQTAGAGSGAATDPGSRVLSTEMDGSVKSLIFRNGGSGCNWPFGSSFYSGQWDGAVSVN